MAHLLARIRSIPRQLLCYGLAWLVVFAFLPLEVPVVSQASAQPPTTQLLLILGQTIAIPFLLLATVSPLVQHWYALVSNHNPYKLYAASNVDSFLALLAYPFLLEPYVALSRQIIFWSAALVGFVGAMILLLWSNLNNAQRAVTHNRKALEAEDIEKNPRQQELSPSVSNSIGCI